MKELFTCDSCGQQFPGNSTGNADTCLECQDGQAQEAAERRGEGF
jgi:hypothetical protein